MSREIAAASCFLAIPARASVMLYWLVRMVTLPSIDAPLDQCG
jgi:hypothetical protein